MDSEFATLNTYDQDLIGRLGEQDYLPALFKGIVLNTLGSTRNNPFFKLKIIALDENENFYDRTQAVRYMNRIPHDKMLENVVECAKKIISDERYPVRERFFFLSNGEKYIKLSDNVVRLCHHHFFKISENPVHYPILLRLLSANFIYTVDNSSLSLWSEARLFIIKLASDENQSVFLRSEAADILRSRSANSTDHFIGDFIIKELGNLYIQNRASTIYTDAQNAHNETISESVMNIVKNLAEDPIANPIEKYEDRKRDLIGFSDQNKPGLKIWTTDHIFSQLLQLSDTTQREKAEKALRHIIIYPIRYEGYCLSDILLFVFRKIQSQPENVKKELEKRLFEELADMDETCGTGYLTRIINVLSGFVNDDNLEIKMNVFDQLRANIFARLSKSMKILSSKDQEMILAEIIDENSDKSAAREFLALCDVKSELYDEFVKTKLVEEEKFNKFYDECENNYIGIVEVVIPDKNKFIETVQKELNTKEIKKELSTITEEDDYKQNTNEEKIKEENKNGKEEAK